MDIPTLVIFGYITKQICSFRSVMLKDKSPQKSKQNAYLNNGFSYRFEMSGKILPSLLIPMEIFDSLSQKEDMYRFLKMK